MTKRIGKSACFVAVGLVAGLLGMTGCGAEGMEGGENAEDIAEIDGQQFALTKLHPLGNKRDSANTVAAKRLAKAPAPPGAIPSKVDLSGSMPTPGDQQTQGSCTAWATGYAAKSFHEITEMKWSRTSASHQFSPAWIYNQINGGSDGGSAISSALDLIVNKGADNLADFPYDTTNFTRQPAADSLARASHFKAKSWATLATSEAAIKSTLASGNVVVVSIAVLPDFDALNSTTNTVYDTAAGTTSTCSTAPCIRGYHAITLVGYDDAKKAFKLINSWGTGWGSGGYGWLAYSFVTNGTLGLYPYLLTDAPNTGATGYGICGVGEPGCERAPTTMHRNVMGCSGGQQGTEEHRSLADGYSNYTCNNRFQAQCVDDGSADSYYMEWCSYGGATCLEKGAKHFGCDPGAKPAGDCKATTLHRTKISCDGKTSSQEQLIDLTGGYSNFTCSNRFSEQCGQDGSWDNYYSEWCEYTCK